MTGALRGRAGPAIALACAAAAVVLGIAEASFQRASSSLGNLAARGQARSAVQLVMRRILDAETAQRGFLITGRQEYLVPFKEVNSDVAQSMAQLRAHYANDPARIGSPSARLRNSRRSRRPSRCTKEGSTLSGAISS
jgi:CHASE3 domain sensor protein